MICLNVWLIYLPPGICWQPRHPLPRDLSEERQQRRASFPNHGSPNQGAYGYNNCQQQAHSTSRTRTRCSIRICRRLLLSISPHSGYELTERPGFLSLCALERLSFGSASSAFQPSQLPFTNTVLRINTPLQSSARKGIRYVMAGGDGERLSFQPWRVRGFGIGIDLSLPGFSALGTCCVVSSSLLLWQFGIDYANQSIILETFEILCCDLFRYLRSYPSQSFS